MSRIIKAAELKVLVPEDSTEIIRPVMDKERGEEPTLNVSAREGTILEASDLIAQAKAKAAEIIQSAEEETQALRLQVNQEIDELREMAKAEGYQAGYGVGVKEGQARADQESARLLQLLQELVERAAADRVNALAKQEEDVLKLSLILAEKIVRKAVSEDHTWLKPVIQEAYEKLGAVNECIIRLNPEDYAVLQTEEIRLNRLGPDRISFRPDPNLNLGECIIETDGGTVDASLEKRLGKLARHLLEVIYDG